MVVGLERQAWVQIGLSVTSTAMWPLAIAIYAIPYQFDPHSSAYGGTALGWLLALTLLVAFSFGVILPFVCFPMAFHMFSLYRHMPVEQRDSARCLIG
ncbi:MAG: hypothetical protein JRI25_21560 [Deltaproteobacteria bacterium]|nr:hypothetical protein [Deltaproteobacteria bacterium]